MLPAASTGTFPRAARTKARARRKRRSENAGKKPDFSAANLKDLGVCHYLPGKDLHLFLVRVHACDVALEGLNCTSTFQQRHTGEWVPEVDDFKWTAIEQLHDFCTDRMTATLRALKDLA